VILPFEKCAIMSALLLVFQSNRKQSKTNLGHFFSLLSHKQVAGFLEQAAQTGLCTSCAMHTPEFTSFVVGYNYSRTGMFEAHNKACLLKGEPCY